MRMNFCCTQLLFLCMVPVVCFASNKKEFLTQTTIDTLIQQAFVNLNASTGADVPDAEARHRQAVADAKETAARLRAMAKGDRNEKYVLWKVNELEHQVFLEERDMVLNSMQKGQKAENILIDKFNKELGKKRPDFILLAGLCRDMQEMNLSKGGEMQFSLDQRSDGITQDVIRSIEKALIAGDQTISKNEFDYCTRNRTVLKIPPEKAGWFAMKISSQIEAMKQEGAIDQELGITGPFLAHNKIGILRKSITDLQGKLYRIMPDLPVKDRESYKKKINTLIETVTRKEDSLVSVCTKLLKTRGDDAALDYLENVLKPCGVSEEKIGQANAQILHQNIPQNNGDTAVNRQLEALSNEDAPENNAHGIDLGDVRLIAKKKAQQRADSIRALEEEMARVRRVEHAYADSIKNVAEKQAQQTALLENERKANNIAMDIYALIGESKAAEADKKFALERKNLENYLSKDAFEQLKEMVRQARDVSTKRYEKIEDRTVVLVSKSSSTAPGPQNTAGPEQNSDADHEKAKQVITQIYGLIEENKIESAYKRFVQVRRPLEKFLDKEVFAMLESTVVQAYESLEKPGH